MAPMNSKASILNHAKVGRDCPRRGTAATEPREAFGVRRIPALSLRAVRNSRKAPEYGALQTLRASKSGELFQHGLGGKRCIGHELPQWRESVPPVLGQRWQKRLFEFRRRRQPALN